MQRFITQPRWIRLLALRHVTPPHAEGLAPASRPPSSARRFKNPTRHPLRHYQRAGAPVSTLLQPVVHATGIRFINARLRRPVTFSAFALRDGSTVHDFRS